MSRVTRASTFTVVNRSGRFLSPRGQWVDEYPDARVWTSKACALIAAAATLGAVVMVDCGFSYEYVIVPGDARG